MKDKEKNPVLETADQAVKNYEQALRAGLKFQEATWQSWCNLLNESTSSQDLNKYCASATAAATGIMPAARKGMEEGLELLDKNNKASADLIKKAADAAQATTLADGQSKWMEFWRASLGLARSNAEAIMLMNSRAVDSWVGFVQKNAEFKPSIKTA